MKHLIALAALTLCFGAQAQTLGQSQTNQSTSNAGASNQGVVTNVNSYGADHITTAGRTDLHSNQAWGVPTSVAPAGTAPCFSAGRGLALQVVGGGASYSGGGEKDVDCKFGNLIATVRNIEAARAPLTVREADGTVRVLPADNDLYVALKALGCKIEDVADAYEETSRPCAEPMKRADRQKRMASGAVAPTAVLPKPYMPGG